MLISCPTCHREVEGVADDFPHRPFCSSRCKLIDLGRWLDESYRISTPIAEIAEINEGDEGALELDEDAPSAALRRLRSDG